MNILLPFKQAYQSLRANRARSLLTVLGVVIGISSVIVILSAGQALRGYVQSEIDSFGSNIIQVEIKVPSADQQSSENIGGIAMGITITTLQVDDAEAVGKLPNISSQYAAVLGQDLASYERENEVINIYGVTDQFIKIDQSQIDSGRFFDSAEDKSLAQVVVLGSGIKEKLFGEKEALGEKIKIGRLKYEVIGVMEERGTSLFFNMDELAIIPLRTLQKKVMGIEHIMYFVATMDDPSQDDITKARIEDLLRERHNISDPKKDDFAVTTQAEMQDMLNVILGGVQLLLIAIASISLVVGGVGIMNIMYVSVSERTFEIGLRKSLGATPKNILWQFLWEAIFVTFLGAFIGIILGVLVAEIMTLAARYFGVDFSFILPWWSVVLAVGFALVVGLVFGLYPAKKAAKLDPIEALRK